jgi:hypothetical protein
VSPPKAESAHVTLTSLSWNAATVTWRLSEPRAVEIALLAPERRPIYEGPPSGLIGRCEMGGLAPDTEHRVRIAWRGGAQECALRTLPAPEGELLMAYAALADPHISLASHNKKGRLLVASRSILREIVEDCNARELDAVLLAGDLTDHGEREEYEAASAILAELACPLFAAPGDHDFKGSGATEWTARFGACPNRRVLGGAIIFTLNTAGQEFGEENLAFLEAHWHDGSGPRIICSHLQLFPDDYIRTPKQKCVRDFAARRHPLEELFRESALVYVGHQNVPSTARLARALQVNVPQPVQYPCGWLLVERYANGFYHRFMPIRSEELRQRSRAETDRAGRCHEQPHYRASYREGSGIGASCFLFPTPARRR